ncbi:hypothetical protein [Clostridium perfringens]|uniref:hypothetical protein n=1 Tax=Clostridium perfringens TaxID=1502 RepID=UPI0039EA5C6C
MFLLISLLKAFFIKDKAKFLEKIDEANFSIYEYRGIRIVDTLNNRVIRNLIIIAIDRIPNDVLSIVKKRLNLIRIERKDSDVFRKNSGGFFAYTDDVIYVKKRYIGIIDAVLHEMGHAFDYSISKSNISTIPYSVCTDFKERLSAKDYNCIKNNFGKYFISNIQEVFAEMFANNFRKSVVKTTTKNIKIVMNSIIYGI